MAKLVQGRRGGYCFEHNTLLLHVLEALGFDVTVLSARGRYQVPPQVRRPRTHVLLRVELQGESYLVDGGFGGCLRPRPSRSRAAGLLFRLLARFVRVYAGAHATARARDGQCLPAPPLAPIS